LTAGAGRPAATVDLSRLDQAWLLPQASPRRWRLDGQSLGPSSSTHPSTTPTL
jgi:hypothetical protein